MSLPEIERWVLSWGAHATVIRPDSLRNNLREVASDLVARYELAAKPARRDISDVAPQNLTLL